MLNTASLHNNEFESFIDTHVCKGCENCNWCDLDAKVSCACNTLKLDGYRLDDLVDRYYDGYLLVKLYIERWNADMF